jgi:hypothetical protein
VRVESSVLGVSVVDSVGDFVAWLLPGPESLLGLPPISYSYCPSVTSEDSSKLPLSDEDMSIVWYLYGAPSNLLACFTFQHSTPRHVRQPLRHAAICSGIRRR